MKTAILGGGVTGVTTAAMMARRGLDYTLYEAAPRLGGLCRSEVIDGFTVDVAGGHIIFSKDEEVLGFIMESLQEIGTHESVRKSAIFYRDRFVKYPFENGLADLPKADNFDCLKGYVESYFQRCNGAEEPSNFRDWCLWRFGEGICQHFMFPYNEKIWNVDLTELSSRWVSGRIPDAPIEDVLRSSVGIPTEGYKHQSVFWYPLTGGFESIIRSIAAPLDQDRLHVGTPVNSVKRKGSGWLVNGDSYDKVINTMPLGELVNVVEEIPEEVRLAFGRLRFTSLATVFLAVDAPCETDRSWVYFPHPETGPFNRMTHLSNYSPMNAPEGKSSLMLEVTYHDDLDTGEEFQQGIVRNLHDLGLVDREKVLWTKAWKNRYAYILYTHDLEENLEIVKGWLASVGVDTVGRFANYDYFNSDQCIRSAMDLVKGF